MMSVNIRLAKLEDHHRCAELLNVLAKATSDPMKSLMLKLLKV